MSFLLAAALLAVAGAQDEEMRASIRAALADTRVEIQVHDGVVLLSGTVDSLEERDRVRETVLVTPGIRGILDFIEVKPPVPRPDAGIEADVRRALAKDAAIDASVIDVEVRGGVVVLSGTVEGEADKLRVVARAEVPGAVAVDAERLQTRAPRVIVPPPAEERPAETPDAVLQRLIENELWRSPYVDSTRIRVRVHDGVALLAGTVRSLAERDQAEIEAREAGAARVANELRVGS